MGPITQHLIVTNGHTSAIYQCKNSMHAYEHKLTENS